MLEVEIKLNPFGTSEHTRTLTTIYIANVNGVYGYFDYVYMIYEPASSYSREVLIHGMVLGYNQRQAASKLLQAVMLDYGESSCRLSQQYADRCMEERL